MRFIFTFAAAAGAAVLFACSVESTTTKPTTDSSKTDPGSSGDDGSNTSETTTTSSSSGGSSSGGSSSGGSSSGGSSSGSTAATCTAPSISSSTTLGSLTTAEKGELCDYAACPFGGYGKSKSCSGGTSVKSKSSQSTCTSDPTWSNCADITVGDYLGCADKINADPCNSLQTLTTDPACAAFKDCAFGG